MSIEERHRTLQLYNGYCQMPLLWESNFEGLSQIPFSLTDRVSQELKVEPGNQRLGKLAESLFSAWVENNKEWQVIFENLQIFDRKNTIGELDICLQHSVTKKQYHIELVTKYYLYNPAFNCNDVEAWIGPNRNDSLAKKISKLKNKQLPLLFNPLSKEALAKYQISTSTVEQLVCFKAWLFVPLQFKEELSTFNKDCIGGFYMDFENFATYSKHFSDFYVPSKQNWLRFPNTQVEWFSFLEISDKIAIYLNANKAVLVWLKKKNQYKRVMITPYSTF